MEYTNLPKCKDPLSWHPVFVFSSVAISYMQMFNLKSMEDTAQYFFFFGQLMFFQ